MVSFLARDQHLLRPLLESCNSLVGLQGADAMWDAIVIGSGIGGLAAAAALAKRGRRVLVLEQHSIAGGLTQTFRRQDWDFAPGVHYIGGVGPHRGQDGQFGRLLAWLTDGALSFTACANPYDIIHLPGFEFGIAHPESAYRDALQSRFPQQRAAIAAVPSRCSRCTACRPG
jgi:all-trans-retinol 13,14-reductase